MVGKASLTAGLGQTARLIRLLITLEWHDETRWLKS